MTIIVKLSNAQPSVLDKNRILVPVTPGKRKTNSTSKITNKAAKIKKEELTRLLKYKHSNPDSKGETSESLL